MTGVLLRRREDTQRTDKWEETEAEMGRMQLPAREGTPRLQGAVWRLGEAWDRFSLPASRRNQPS